MFNNATAVLEPVAPAEPPEPREYKLLNIPIDFSAPDAGRTIEVGKKNPMLECAGRVYHALMNDSPERLDELHSILEQYGELVFKKAIALATDTIYRENKLARYQDTYGGLFRLG